MMYRVVWRQSAFAAMDAIVRGHPGRVRDIADALKELTAGMRSSADTYGESRRGRTGSGRSPR